MASSTSSVSESESSPSSDVESTKEKISSEEVAVTTTASSQARFLENVYGSEAKLPLIMKSEAKPKDPKGSQLHKRNKRYLHDLARTVRQQRDAVLQNAQKLADFEKKLQKFILRRAQKTKRAASETTEPNPDLSASMPCLPAPPSMPPLPGAQEAPPSEDGKTGDKEKENILVQPTKDGSQRVFRRRYLDMLKQMEEDARRRREDEEAALKRKEQTRLSLLRKSGVDKVGSRVFQLAEEGAGVERDAVPAPPSCPAPATSRPTGPTPVALVPSATQSPFKRAKSSSVLRARVNEARVSKEGGVSKEVGDEPLGARVEEDERQQAVAARKREANKELLSKHQAFLAELQGKRKEEEARLAKLKRREELMRQRIRDSVVSLGKVNGTRGDELSDADTFERSDKAGGDKEDGAGENTPGERTELEGRLEDLVIARRREKFSTTEEEEAWMRKTYKLGEDQRIFVTSYQIIRQSLLSRGWWENPDPESYVFDLKWCLKTSDIDFRKLRKEQIVNHFCKNSAITTKVGLLKSMQSLKWFEDVDTETFFPRCYDLSDADDFDDFIEDFKNTASEAVLKRYLAKGVNMTHDNGEPVGSLTQVKTTVALALRVLDAKLRRSSLEHLDQDLTADDELTADEWTQLLNDTVPKIDTTGYNLQVIAAREAATSTRSAQAKAKAPTASGAAAWMSQLEEMTLEELKDKAEQILAQLKQDNPQFDINGQCNTWIVKPAGKSRGRGITIKNKLAEIFKVIGFGVPGAELHWIAQKYIENPLLVNGRKFDFRQWLLVTDWNPLTLWFYNENYLRFCLHDFTLTDLDDPFAHLCNNSIQKDQEGFEEFQNESMWTMQQFVDMVKEEHGSSDIWDNKILPSLKKAALWGAMCGQGHLDSRKNSCELYGYDFMLDEDYNVWLIEINCSPAMDFSTPVTERLCPMVLEDTIKVIVDHHDSLKKKKKDEEPASTGGWDMLFKGDTEVAHPIASFGERFLCKGDQINIRKMVNAKATPKKNKKPEALQALPSPSPQAESKEGGALSVVGASSPLTSPQSQAVKSPGGS